MGKNQGKKNKPQVVNNIQKLNLEIDYDKLAEAIVKAQEKGEEEANKNKKFTSGAFSVTTSVVLRVVAVLGGLLSLASPFVIINVAKTFMWNEIGAIIGNVLGILFFVAWVAVLALYSWLLWKSAKEIETEKDRNYIISVFSGIVSFAALIVALVALLKGVG